MERREARCRRARALGLCALLLRVGGLAVPATRRAEWWAEWWAELVWRHDDLRRRGLWDAHAGRGLIRRAVGSLPDALTLRLERTRARALRGRVAVGRLSRTPVLGAAAVLTPALALTLTAAALATVSVLDGGHDDGLVRGTWILVGLAVLLSFAAVYTCRRALPHGRAAQDAALSASVLIALAVGPAAAGFLAEAIELVGQDPVPPPSAAGVMLTLVVLPAILGAVPACTVRGGRSRHRVRALVLAG